MPTFVYHLVPGHLYYKVKARYGVPGRVSMPTIMYNMLLKALTGIYCKKRIKGQIIKYKKQPSSIFWRKLSYSLNIVVFGQRSAVVLPIFLSVCNKTKSWFKY